MRGLYYLLIITICISCSMWCRKTEKKQWNNGVCCKCGTKWVIDNTDKQGGRVYKCPKCNTHCYIFYKVDRNNK